MITFQKPNHAKGNEALQEKVREEFCRGEIKEKINGNLILSQDSSAILDVTMGDLRYTACGDVVQPALKRPLSMEKVRENMEKTGNTPFEFENLTIAMRDAIFPSDEILKPAQKRCVRRTGKALCGTVPQGGGTGGLCRNEGAGEYSRYTREIFVCSDRAEMSVTAAFGE